MHSTVRVITPPEPIVMPEAVPGSHAPDDAGVAALIAAATEEIDGPGGWLGRALGPQTLELTVEHPCSPVIRLPCPPVIEVLEAWSGDNPLPIDQYRPGAAAICFGSMLPAGKPVRIRYRAGYDNVAVNDGGTGPVPERARQAIILAVQDLMRTGSTKMGLRSETVEGIGAKQFLDQDRVSAVVERTCERLLSTLRIYTL